MGRFITSKKYCLVSHVLPLDGAHNLSISSRVDFTASLCALTFKQADCTWTCMFTSKDRMSNVEIET